MVIVVPFVQRLKIIIGDYWLALYYGNLEVRYEERKVRSHYKVC